MRQISFLLAGLLAVNNPTALLAQIHFTAAMDGSQELPPITTPATGTGSFELSEDLTKLTYFVSFQQMSAGGVEGHFFIGKPGIAGTIIGSVIAPTSSSGTSSGVWRNTDPQPFTEAIAESLLAGKVYVDFEDGTYPAGEIRGQVILGTSLHFEAVCSGSQETPPDSELGGATGVFVLDPAKSKIDYWLTYEGLTGPLLAGAELCTGSTGTSGSAVRSIAPAGTPASSTIRGSWKTSDSGPLTSALIDSMIAGRMYLNLPTATHAGGEIRGQLDLRGGIGFVASIDSSQETPSTNTGASATGSFILNDAHNQVAYNVTFVGLSGSEGQIHNGSVGLAGPSVKTIDSNNNPSEATLRGTWLPSDPSEGFTPQLAESLLTGGLYVELGADAGEKIRGQLNLTTGIGLTAQLSADQDVPPTVSSHGTGTSSVVLSPDRQSVSYSLTFLNLTSNIAEAGGHFHLGPRGANGGAIKTIVPPNAWGSGSVNGVWQTSDGGPQFFTRAIADAFATEDIYINLHTGDYIGGEIRGQVSYAFDLLSLVPPVPPVSPTNFDLEQNYPNPFNPSTQIEFSLPRQEHVVLEVYDVLGRSVETLVNGVVTGGRHSVEWKPNGKDSGVYFCRLQTESSTATRKLLYLK